MKPNPTPSLDEQLRAAAQARRAVLEAQAEAYPVGDYPARPVVDGVRQAPLDSQPSVWARLAWLLGLGGVTTAGLVGLLTLAVTWSSPTSTDGGDSPLAFTPPQPEAIAQSVRSLVTGLHQAEVGLGQRLDPTFSAALMWPAQLGSLGQEALSQAESDLKAPVDQELAALRADLQTATDYLRRQWRTGDAPAAMPGQPTSDRLQPLSTATG